MIPESLEHVTLLPRDPITDTENVFMEPKYHDEEVIGHPLLILTI